MGMKTIIATVCALAIAATAMAQYNAPGYNDRNVTMPTENGKNNPKNDPSQRRYSQHDAGFWFAVEAAGGYSLNTAKGLDNTAFGEIDAYGGYRFNEHFKAGLGIGGRYYFDPGMLRRTHHNWALPVMLNVRGNLIPQDYRTVVPFYSVDFGVSVTDAFMFRPTIGIRCGEPRSAFLVGVSYMLQNMRGWKLDKYTETYDASTRSVSFIALKIGYEF